MTNDTKPELSPDDVYRRCDPDSLGFETTATVPPSDGTVGQDRAVASLEFGLGIDADGYNLFVTGPIGVGRTSTLRAIVTRLAAAKAAPPSWCYVYDFRDTRQPSVLSMPAGRAEAFAHDIDAFVVAARREIPRVFESDVYTQRREETGKEFQQQRDVLFNDVEQEARKRGFTISVSPMGITTIPVKDDGQPMSREEFIALPEERRTELQKQGEELESIISQAMVQARPIEKEARAAIEQLDKAIAMFAITPLLNELREDYMDIAKAMTFIDHVQEDVVANLAMFRAEEAPANVASVLRPSADEFFVRYKVNVIVSRSEDEHGAPVVFEDNPTYTNLFGRVDYRSQLGAVTTDHSMIKAGAVHRANGGYLVLQTMDVLRAPFVWETLKRTIRCGEARIENLGEQLYAIPVATLAPQPIPLNLKVVMVGSPSIFYLLNQAEPDFRKLFRVKADFSVDMDRTDESIKLYAGFISRRIRDEGLRPFDKTAVARVIEHGSRLVGHQGKLSTRFIDIADLLTEADYWAGEAGSDVVRREHVQQAIEEKTYRLNLIEERVHEMIEDGTILIDASDGVVGQVNGLSVLSLGEYAFGRPTRLTASVSPGRGQVVSIEREIQLSGKVHNKGFAILSGYLLGKYAQQRPLALGATIVFEQTYDEIDGDSASAAELYVLLSALGDVPIKQGIAVTGSMNQRGEIQAIGSVNEKVEGFYSVSKAKGLTGEQGVIIPRTNVKHLMLRPEIVDAIRDGRFHIWPIDHVEQGIEILTGVPAGEPGPRGRYAADTINRRVTDKLTQFARRMAAVGRQARRPSQDGPLVPAIPPEEETRA
ncbi:MAG: ATP-binding protein [Dehalococcoidia bacterium]